MAVNPLKRRLRLAVLLLSGTELGLVSLANLLECSRRTLFRDLNELRDIGGIETAYNRKDRVVRCTSRPVFDRNDLSAQEVSALILAASTSPIRRVPTLNEALVTAAKRMRGTLTKEQNELIGRQLSSICIPEPSVSYGDHKWLGVILESIGQASNLRITYEEKPSVHHEIVVTPRQLVHDFDQWWLLAYSEFHHRSIISFPVSGLLSACEEESAAFIEPRGIVQRIRLDGPHHQSLPKPMTLREFQDFMTGPVRTPTRQAKHADTPAGISGTRA